MKRSGEMSGLFLLNKFGQKKCVETTELLDFTEGQSDLYTTKNDRNTYFYGIPVMINRMSYISWQYDLYVVKNSSYKNQATLYLCVYQAYSVHICGNEKWSKLLK